MLDSNASLERLRLSDAGIESEGAGQIAAKLKSCQALRGLDLSDNGIDRRGTEQLAGVLAACQVPVRPSYAVCPCPVLTCALWSQAMESLNLRGNAIALADVRLVMGRHGTCTLYVL